MQAFKGVTNLVCLPWSADKYTNPFPSSSMLTEWTMPNNYGNVCLIYMSTHCDRHVTNNYRFSSPLCSLFWTMLLIQLMDEWLCITIVWGHLQVMTWKNLVWGRLYMWQCILPHHANVMWSLFSFAFFSFPFFFFFLLISILSFDFTIKNDC